MNTFPIPDPWRDDNPYEQMALAGVDAQSPLQDIRDGFFLLLEQGLLDDAAQVASEELQIVGRRLMADALMYDADVAQELLELLVEPSSDDVEQRPLQSLIPFAWDV
jgi:hypothetical protein